MRGVTAYNGVSGVYLLHFTPRYKHAGHYLGYADDIGKRVYQHEYGQSDVRLIKAAVAAGCSLHVVRVWPGADRNEERRLKGGRMEKRRGSLARLCPKCHECQSK